MNKKFLLTTILLLTMVVCPALSQDIVGTWKCISSYDVVEGKELTNYMKGQYLTVNADGTYTSTSDEMGYGSYTFQGNQFSAKNNKGAKFTATVSVDGNNLTMEGSSSYGVSFTYVFERVDQIDIVGTWKCISSYDLVEGKELTNYMKGQYLTVNADGSYTSTSKEMGHGTYSFGGNSFVAQNNLGVTFTATLFVSSDQLTMEGRSSSGVTFQYVFEKSSGEPEPSPGGEVETKRTIHVAQAGTLYSYISEEEKYQIEELTLTGELNSGDLGFIRNMAGKETYVREKDNGSHFGDTKGRLKSIDFSGAKIVVGGYYSMMIEGIDGDSFYTVTRDDEIPPRLFEGCKNLVSISISNSVSSIGSYAFEGTTWYENQPDGLVYIGNVLYAYKGEMPKNTSVKIKEGTIGIACSAFANCSNMVSIEIPNSVKIIGGILRYPYFDYNSAFSGCTGLTSVQIPNSVVSIGTSTFTGCSSLASITIPNSVTYIGSSAFHGTPWYDNQPDGIVYAGKVLYSYKGTMPQGTAIEIEEGTLTIAADAFYNCSGLTSIKFPSSVTSIGWSAFEGCKGLRNVYCYAETVPGSFFGYVRSYFYSFDATLYVPANSIEAYSNTEPWSYFKEILPIEGSGSSGSCGENLTWTYDEDTKTLTISGTGEMDNFGLTDSPWYEINKSIQSVVIEPGVTTIGIHAFAECTELVSVSIPNSVTTIGAEAFRNCGLTSLTIPNSVISIGQSAFLGCSGLTSILIPNSVTEIWHYAFYFCSNVTTLTIGSNVKRIAPCALFMLGLTDIYCYAEDTPEAIWAFQDDDEIPKDIVQSATLHVPASSLNAYKSTKPWSNFKEIVPLDGSGVQAIEADNRVIQINSIRGERLSAPSKGINIIKMKDGTIKKVLIK